MLERFVSAVPTQSEAFREAVRRAEEAAQPKPPKKDDRPYLLMPNGGRTINPNYGKEIE